jgi:hypothetical protein
VGAEGLERRNQNVSKEDIMYLRTPEFVFLFSVHLNPFILLASEWYQASATK